MIAHRGLMVRDARRCRAPHHEGLGEPHPEEAPTGPREARPDDRLRAVSKDVATELENALIRSGVHAIGGCGEAGFHFSGSCPSRAAARRIASARRACAGAVLSFLSARVFGGAGAGGPG